MPLPANLNFRSLLTVALTAAGCGQSAHVNGSAPGTPAGTQAPTAAATPATAPADTPATAPADTPATAPTETPDCASFRLGQGLSPATPVDATLVAQVSWGGFTNDKRTWSLTVEGKPCWTAMDRATCEASFEALKTQLNGTQAWSPLGLGKVGEKPAASDTPYPSLLKSGCTPHPANEACGGWALGYASGGGVTWITDDEALTQFMGSLDTPSEAALATMLAGYEPSCVRPEPVNGTWRITSKQQTSDCPITHLQTELTLSPEGAVTVLSEEEHVSAGCIGRLPPGLQWVEGTTEEVGAWLAHAAHLEAAAVTAFDILHTELSHYGAPDALLDALREAQADEVRHAACVGALAEQLGAVVPPVEVDDVPLRSLEAIAIENAEEGLVRETWGAAVGLWQAQHAELPALGALMASVAQDEVRHAELSRALHTWLCAQLDAPARRRVERARRAAWQRMQGAIARQAPSDLTRALGLPTGEAARRMFSVLGSETGLQA